MERELEEKRQATVQLSLTEAGLGLLLIVVTVAGLSLGTGFVLGTRSNHTAEVVQLCQDVSRANEDRVHAIKFNYDILQQQLENYETFLLDTGLKPTLPLATAVDQHAHKHSPRLGRGGSP